jgi:CheY-like chemotaxis protein
MAGRGETPIIALTANAVSGMREMFLQNGFSDFLSKPITVQALDAILTKWISLEKQWISLEKQQTSDQAGENKDF